MLQRNALTLLLSLALLGCLNSCSFFKKSDPLIVSTAAPQVVEKPVVNKPVEVVTPKPVLKPKPKSSALSTEYGLASWYSVKTNGGTKTASGRPFRDNAYTAAHKKLPMGSKVRVTSLFNGRSEILTISDRGPYVKGRIIDVSIGSAKRLGFYSRGVTKVKVEVLSRGTWKYQH